ncbi:MAG TPA: AsnC family transcriptional regulator [Actinocrinis sp.]|jgi:DNA-binding Lrp family transcriptional regulator
MIDRIDRNILHGLSLDPRIGYAKLADVLGVSEQTVARRYHRMRSEGLVRVIGLTTGERAGLADWTVRLGCRPGTASAIAAALARRDDVAWLGIAAGGTEVVLLVRSRLGGQLGDRDGDLLERLPHASNVLSMSAYQTLHRFRGRGERDWVGLDQPLTEEQRAQLFAGYYPARESDAGSDAAAQQTAYSVGPADRPLLDALARDGRAGYAELAAETGWSHRQVARRMSALVESGALYFDVDIAVSLVGFQSTANLWLTVEPARLHAVGSALADHVEVPFVGAVTGQQNLLASVLTTDPRALYRYLTTKIAALEGVRQMEISPMPTRLKQAGSLIHDQRLTDPAAPAAARRRSG